ncbi:glycerol kinase GlpK [uncultured Secundilactobacillus sp.]|uniref:glycerol kinase GlpK n=1 Tax=uncultured Secundilactobacillus sp. TaxID=2813935 RepID=UPI002585EF65|nr:glycerol kinase GlpK [uncultured Secundilactobacillus sp.]
MTQKYILSLDIGTTRASATLYDRNFNALFSSSKHLNQYSPQPGWYEQDAEEIWEKLVSCVTNLLIISKCKPSEIAGIGISNQRETTIIWDKTTGQPIYNALAWESRQTEPLVQNLINAGYTDVIHDKTGLFIDPYFSATKIIWILSQVDNARKMAEHGQLLFGTIDSWIVWKLTKGALHITDYTNASRTMMFNIHTLQWDDDLLEIFNIPASLLPEVKSNSEVYGKTNAEIFFNAEVPIAALAGDQQAALVGGLATNVGEVEGSYGTGAFIIMNTGKQLVMSKRHLLTTIAYSINGECTYAIEGSIFVAGSALQWLKDNLEMIDNVDDVEQLAKKSTDDGRLYVVPSFTGLSAPYWNANANAATFGMTQKSTKYDYIRATLESIAYQTNDILTSMVKDSNMPIKNIRVNGEVVKNDYLPQFLADITGTMLHKKTAPNIDSLGVAYLAGLAVGLWHDFHEISQLQQNDEALEPTMTPEARKKRYRGWQRAVKAVEFYTES